MKNDEPELEDRTDTESRQPSPAEGKAPWQPPVMSRFSFKRTLSAFNSHTDGHATGSVPS